MILALRIVGASVEVDLSTMFKDDMPGFAAWAVFDVVGFSIGRGFLLLLIVVFDISAGRIARASDKDFAFFVFPLDQWFAANWTITADEFGFSLWFFLNV